MGVTTWKRIGKPLVSVAAVLLAAQNALAAGSLYSVYGLGKTSVLVSGQARGMGGGGIALTDPLAVNALNPGASIPSPLTRVSASFVYEGDQLRSETSSGWHNYTGAVAFRFHVPISESWGLIAGLYPVTTRDYRLRAAGTTRATAYHGATDVTYEQTLEGKGGLSALALDICHVFGDQLSVGLGGRFLHGKLENTWRLDFDRDDFLATEDSYSLHMRGATVVAGVVVKPKPFWSLGAFYQASCRLRTERRSESIYVRTDTASVSRSSYPAMWGFGQAVRIGNVWSVVVDYWQQDWRRYHFGGERTPLARRAWRLSAGVQYSRPSTPFASFWQKLEPRFGAYREVLPFSPVPDRDLIESAVTVGLGLPLPEARGRVDLAVEAGVRGDQEEFPVEERFVRLVVSFVGAEKWFTRGR